MVGSIGKKIPIIPNIREMVPAIISKYLKKSFDMIFWLYAFFTMSSTLEIDELLNNLLVIPKKQYTPQIEL